VDANWGTSNAGDTNWSGDLLPKDGDSLLFPLVAANRTNTNNISGLDLNAITFGGIDYVITGNAISIVGGLSDGSAGGNNQFNPDITLVASQTFNVTAGSTTLSVGGALSGNADLDKDGDGTLQFTGATDKEFNGTTQIRDGVLLLNTTTSGGNEGISANVVIGDDVEGANTAVLRLPNNGQVPQDAAVTVLSDGLLDKTGTTGLTIRSLTLGSTAGGGNVAIAAGSSLAIKSSGSVTSMAAPTASTIAGPGKLVLSGGAFSAVIFRVANSLNVLDDLVISADISATAGLTKEGAGRMLLNAACSYHGTTTISGGTLAIGVDNAILYVSFLVVNDFSVFDLNGFNQTFSVVRSGIGVVTNSSPTPATLTIDTGASLQFDGRLGGNLELSLVSIGRLTLAGALSNTYSGPTLVNAGVLILNKAPGVQAVGGLVRLAAELRLGAEDQIGDTAIVSIDPGGLFALNGHSEAVQRIDLNGGVLDAGTRTQVLRVNDLGSPGGGTWHVALNGTAAGSTYDQIAALNSVDLTGVNLDLTFGFTPHVGDQFMLIDNAGGPVVGNFNGLVEGAVGSIGGHTVRITYVGGDGNDVVLTYVHGAGLIAVGPDKGTEPRVRVFDARTREEVFSFLAFGPTYRGGVRVAVGDVNDDGVPDIVCAPGARSTVANGAAAGIRVFDGLTAQPLSGVLGSGFNPFGATFRKGFWIAAADFDADGRDDIVVAPNTGFNPQVKVISGADGVTVLKDLTDLFPATGSYKRGVHVAAGDVNGDTVPDLVVAAGTRTAARVRALSGTDFAPLPGTLGAGFNPFADQTNVKGPLFVAVGDVDGTGHAQVIVSARNTRLVRLFDETGAQMTEFEGHSDAAFTGGLTVAAVDADGDGKADVVVGTGKGKSRRPEVRIVDPETSALIDDVFAFESLFRGGVFVAGG
jgi:autotransporter-associated beta strand protein